MYEHHASETLVSAYVTAGYQNPEQYNLNNPCCNNLRIYVTFFFLLVTHIKILWCGPFVDVMHACATAGFYGSGRDTDEIHFTSKNNAGNITNTQTGSSKLQIQVPV
jgi:hypothetical protein